MATPRDRSNIIWEPDAAFKGTTYENVCKVEKYYSRPALAWRKPLIEGGGAHTSASNSNISAHIGFKFEHLGKFEFAQNDFKVLIRGLGDFFGGKKTEAKFLVPESLRTPYARCYRIRNCFYLELLQHSIESINFRMHSVTF